jgi:group I intron endonuclease
MKTGSLYIVYNDINDKVYVGITVRKVHRRFHEHIYAAEAEKDNFQFHKAIRKYGSQNFHVDCLLSGIPIERLPLFEKACISRFNSYKCGYNSTPGGDGTGKEVTDEFRQKISELHKGKTPCNKGVPMPDWLKEKLLATHIGKKHSEETRKKMSKARVGRKPMLEKHHSEETRKRISKALKGKPQPWNSKTLLERRYAS